jgi:hypothetical protein
MDVTEQSPERNIARFMGRYSPTVERVARQARRKLRRLLPGAVELVYDNYNAPGVGQKDTAHRARAGG